MDETTPDEGGAEKLEEARSEERGSAESLDTPSEPDPGETPAEAPGEDAPAEGGEGDPAPSPGEGEE